MADLIQDGLLGQVNAAEHDLELFLNAHDGIIDRHPNEYSKCVNSINEADRAYDHGKLTQELVNAFVESVQAFKLLN